MSEVKFDVTFKDHTQKDTVEAIDKWLAENAKLLANDIIASGDLISISDTALSLAGDKGNIIRLMVELRRIIVGNDHKDKVQERLDMIQAECANILTIMSSLPDSMEIPKFKPETEYVIGSFVRWETTGSMELLVCGQPHKSGARPDDDKWLKANLI